VEGPCPSPLLSGVHNLSSEEIQGVAQKSFGGIEALGPWGVLCPLWLTPSEGSLYSAARSQCLTHHAGAFLVCIDF
jgi:hypothetical protein